MLFDRLIAVLNSNTINYTHNANNELTVAGAIAYLYDQNGNTVQETSGTQITKYIYNSSNRLERVELPDGRIAEYKYDPFGRRISKTISNSASADGLTTYYLYADEGLVGEYDSAGNLQKAYGWIPDTIWGTNPVFMLENNNYYFYHNDHLGTPQKMTDEAGNVVWSATYTAFGEAAIDAGSTITNNLRFAGQYFDEETGKHYNWNRYYDPKTGRYTQVDPIGFYAGDTNLYRYVKNNVINGTDPEGLGLKFNPDYSGEYPGDIELGYRGKCESYSACLKRCAKDTSPLGLLSRFTPGNSIEKFRHSLVGEILEEAFLSNDIANFIAEPNLYDIFKFGGLHAVEEFLNVKETWEVYMSLYKWQKYVKAGGLKEGRFKLSRFKDKEGNWVKGQRLVSQKVSRFKLGSKLGKLVYVKLVWDGATTVGCLAACGN